MSWKKYIINGILIFLFIMSLGLSIGYNNELKNENNVANYYFEEGASIETVEASLKDSEYAYTTWKEEKGKELYQPELENSYYATLLTINGDSSLLIKGNILFKEDKTGCLIGEEVAKNLFGGVDVVGNVIKYNSIDYVVRGINKSNKDSIVIQQPYSSEGNINGIAIDINKNSLKTIEAIGENFGFGKNASIAAESLENDFYYGIARIFSIIVPLIILIILTIYVIKSIRKDRKKPIMCLIYFLILIGLIWIFFKITNIKISIPYNIIPDKWSNFDYWGELIEKYSESYKNIFYMKKYSFDIANIEIMMKSISYSLLSIVLFFILRKRIKLKKFKSLMNLIFFIFICAFIVELVVNSKNIYLDGVIIWLIYPFYLTIDYFNNTKIISSKLKD